MRPEYSSNATLISQRHFSRCPILDFLFLVLVFGFCPGIALGLSFGPGNFSAQASNYLKKEIGAKIAPHPTPTTCLVYQRLVRLTDRYVQIWTAISLTASVSLFGISVWSATRAFGAIDHEPLPAIAWLFASGGSLTFAIVLGSVAIVFLENFFVARRFRLEFGRRYERSDFRPIDPVTGEMS